MTRIHRRSQTGPRRLGGHALRTPPAAPQRLAPLTGAVPIPDAAASAVCQYCGHVVRLVVANYSDLMFGVEYGTRVFGAHDPDDGLAHRGTRGNYVNCLGVGRLPVEAP